jgi:inner membrane protein
LDPLAHTLLGATAAEAGLGRTSRYATATLLIGANLPDVDALATVLGQDTSLALRRGWTHGVLAMVVLPLALAVGVGLWHRISASTTAPDGPRYRAGRIAGLAGLATLSHPLLDLLNTYGVRLLMPFDDRWFYGDTLFIIDPWFWLLTAAAVVLARTRSRGALAGWAVLAALATALFVAAPMVPTAVKIGWCAGVVVVAGLRGTRVVSPTPVARAGFGLLLVYLTIAYGAARVAESTAAIAEYGRSGDAPLEAQANPVPGNPFEHRVVVVHEDRYVVVETDGTTFEVPRVPWTDEARRAASDPSVAGFMNWVRFPYWTIVDVEDGREVVFRDLRYVDPDQPALGIGEARVRLPDSP